MGVGGFTTRTPGPTRALGTCGAANKTGALPAHQLLTKAVRLNIRTHTHTHAHVTTTQGGADRDRGLPVAEVAQPKCKQASRCATPYTAAVGDRGQRSQHCRERGQDAQYCYRMGAQHGFVCFGWARPSSRKPRPLLNLHTCVYSTLPPRACAAWPGRSRSRWATRPSRSSWSPASSSPSSSCTSQNRA